MRTKDIKKLIKRYFYLHPTAKLRVRGIEREAKVPLPSVIRYVKDLESEGILKKNILGDVVFYSANRSSPNFLRKKASFNLNELFESGLVDSLIENFSNPIVICFGSYAKGEDIESSDIDIYLETQSKKGIDLSTYEKKLSRKIHVFKHRSIRRIKNKELMNNVVNGVILNGFLEVF